MSDIWASVHALRTSFSPKGDVELATTFTCSADLSKDWLWTPLEQDKLTEALELQEFHTEMVVRIMDENVRAYILREPKEQYMFKMFARSDGQKGAGLIAPAYTLKDNAEKIFPSLAGKFPVVVIPDLVPEAVAVPAVPEPVPATPIPEPVPAAAEPVPAVPEPVPAVPEPVPAVPEPVPAAAEPVPAAAEPVPAAAEPVPASEIRPAVPVAETPMSPPSVLSRDSEPSSRKLAFKTRKTRKGGSYRKKRASCKKRNATYRKH
jgi:hypothetical protein